MRLPWRRRRPHPDYAKIARMEVELGLADGPKINRRSFGYLPQIRLPRVREPPAFSARREHTPTEVAEHERIAEAQLASHER